MNKNKNDLSSRVVITGFGCMTALGANAQTTWNAIQAGSIGIRHITQWDASNWSYPLGGEIKDFNPEKLISDRKTIRLLCRQDVLGLYAVGQALEKSNLLSFRNSLGDPTSFNDRVGVFVGSPGNKHSQQYDFFPALKAAGKNLKEFGKSVFEVVNPMWLLRTLPNNVLAHTGIQYGFKGPNQNVTNHGVSGIQAMAEAYWNLKEGDIDQAVVVAYDTGLDAKELNDYSALGLLSPQAVRPFDRDRDGTILGEGSGALILETLQSAKERKAQIHGEILGVSVLSEAHGMFALQKEGSGLVRALHHALAHTTLSIKDIGMITAHANGTVQSDASEGAAYLKVFAGHPLPITGFKWGLGHTLAASGMIETILTLLALKDCYVPGIATLNELDPNLMGLHVQKTAQVPLSSKAMVVSRGFGGLNACVILERGNDFDES